MFVLILPPCQLDRATCPKTHSAQLRALTDVAYSVEAFDWSGGMCRGKERDSGQQIITLPQGSGRGAEHHGEHQVQRERGERGLELVRQPVAPVDRRGGQVQG